VKYFLYLAVPVSAVLLYFHLECLTEREQYLASKFNSEYQPDQTDCTAEFSFVKPIDLAFRHTGPELLLIQWMPCSVTKLVSFISGASDPTAPLRGTKNNMRSDSHNLTIWDARKASPGSFSETGFTLVKLDKEPETKNWRMWSQDLELFREQMNPYLKKLYPQTKRIEWNVPVVRGGSLPLDQPRAVAEPHLDYHQDDAKRLEFHSEYPILNDGRNKTDPHYLVGANDTPEEKMSVLLGVWKPLSPSEICDYPLGKGPIKKRTQSIY